jgi:hypothetical protein
MKESEGKEVLLNQIEGGGLKQEVSDQKLVFYCTHTTQGQITLWRQDLNSEIKTRV